MFLKFSKRVQSLIEMQTRFRVESSISDKDIMSKSFAVKTIATFWSYVIIYQ